MGSSRVDLVVTDLDDTIYDWLGFYIPSFLAMVSELHRITGIGEEDLKRSFQRVHRAHRTTEYAFAIESLDVLRDIDADLTIDQKLAKYAPAIEAFRAVRHETLKPYPYVQETLEALRGAGIPVVAHTDSMSGYVSRRLRQLQLDEYFAAICAPLDHGLPPDTPPHLRRRRRNADMLARTRVLVFPLGARKPSVETVRPILDAFAISPHRVLYIGDSISRDIALARGAGFIDVWARYGHQHAREYYADLLRITYWTKEDLEVDDRLRRETQSISPSFVVDRYDELLDICGLR